MRAAPLPRSRRREGAGQVKPRLQTTRPRALAHHVQQAAQRQQPEHQSLTAVDPGSQNLQVMTRRLRPVQPSKEYVISKQVEPRLPGSPGKQPEHRREGKRNSESESRQRLPPA